MITEEEDAPPPLRRVLKPSKHAEFLSNTFVAPDTGIKIFDPIFPCSSAPEERQFRDTDDIEKIIGGPNRVRQCVEGILSLCDPDKTSAFWKTWLRRKITSNDFTTFEVLWNRNHLHDPSQPLLKVIFENQRVIREYLERQSKPTAAESKEGSNLEDSKHRKGRRKMEKDRTKVEIAPELLSKDEIEQKVIQELKEKLREGEKTWAKSSSDPYQGLPAERVPVILSPDLSRAFLKDVLNSSSSGRDIAKWAISKSHCFQVSQGLILPRRPGSSGSLNTQKTSPDTESVKSKERGKDGGVSASSGSASQSGDAKPPKKKSKGKSKRSKRSTSTSGEVPVGYVPVTQARNHSISIIKKPQTESRDQPPAEFTLPKPSEIQPKEPEDVDEFSARGIPTDAGDADEVVWPTSATSSIKLDTETERAIQDIVAGRPTNYRAPFYRQNTYSHSGGNYQRSHRSMSVNAAPFRPRGWIPKVLQKGDGNAPVHATADDSNRGASSVAKSSSVEVGSHQEKSASGNSTAHAESEMLFKESDWPHLSEAASATPVPVSTDATVGSDTSSFGNRGLSNSSGSSSESHSEEGSEKEDASASEESSEPPVAVTQASAKEEKQQELKGVDAEESEPAPARMPAPPSYQIHPRRSGEYSHYNMVPHSPSVGRTYMYPSAQYAAAMSPQPPFQYHVHSHGMYQQNPTYHTPQHQVQSQAQQPQPPQQIPHQRQAPVQMRQHHAPHHQAADPNHGNHHGIIMGGGPVPTPAISGFSGTEDDNLDPRTQHIIQAVYQRMEQMEFSLHTHLANLMHSVELHHQRLDVLSAMVGEVKSGLNSRHDHGRGRFPARDRSTSESSQGRRGPRPDRTDTSQNE